LVPRLESMDKSSVWKMAAAASSVSANPSSEQKAVQDLMQTYLNQSNNQMKLLPPAIANTATLEVIDDAKIEEKKQDLKKPEEGAKQDLKKSEEVAKQEKAPTKSLALSAQTQDEASQKDNDEDGEIEVQESDEDAEDAEAEEEEEVEEEVVEEEEEEEDGQEEVEDAEEEQEEEEVVEEEDAEEQEGDDEDAEEQEYGDGEGDEVEAEEEEEEEANEEQANASPNSLQKKSKGQGSGPSIALTPDEVVDAEALAYVSEIKMSELKQMAQDAKTDLNRKFALLHLVTQCEVWNAENQRFFLSLITDKMLLLRTCTVEEMYLILLRSTTIMQNSAKQK